MKYVPSFCTREDVDQSQVLTKAEQDIVTQNLRRFKNVENRNGGDLTCPICYSCRTDEHELASCACHTCQTIFDVCMGDMCSWSAGCTTQEMVATNLVGYGVRDEVQHIQFPSLPSDVYWNDSQQGGIILMWCPCCNYVFKRVLHDEEQDYDAVTPHDFATPELMLAFQQGSANRVVQTPEP